MTGDNQQNPSSNQPFSPFRGLEGDDLIQQRDQCITAIRNASTLWAEMARLLVVAPDKVTLDQVDQIPYHGLKDLIEQRDTIQQELQRLESQ